MDLNAMSAQSGLQIKHFNAGYPKRKIIEDLNVEPLPRGKITVLLGRTAAGNPPCCAPGRSGTRQRAVTARRSCDLTRMNFAERAEAGGLSAADTACGVHLHVLESVIVAQRASGGFLTATVSRK